MIDKKLYVSLEDCSNLDNTKNYKRPEGIYLGRSDKFQKYFITLVTSNPIDSWGAEWEQAQECVVLTPVELDTLINTLNELKNK